jgi:hypothetical protein
MKRWIDDGGNMKLRIAGNSVRLRLLRTEVRRLISDGRVDETIHFSAITGPSLTYALSIERGLSEVQLRYTPSTIAIVVPESVAISWSDSDQVGIYATVDVGEHGVLNLIVEKDFACLDLSDTDNHDTFPNPQIGAVC